MKATRKLIPAFAMLLIAAVMMSTATFAWFSTNSTTTVNGFVVSAKADTTFLVVGNSEAEVKAANYQVTEITAPALGEGVSNVLIPIAFDETTIGKDDDSLAGALRWFTATAEDRDESTRGDNAKKTATPTAEYALKHTFYFTIATGFVDASNLKLSAVIIDDTKTNKAFADSISVVAIANTSTEWKNANAYDATSKVVTATTPLHASLTAGTVYAVDVYVFIDGEHVDVFTDNIKNLQDLGVTIKFTVG